MRAISGGLLHVLETVKELEPVNYVSVEHTIQRGKHNMCSRIIGSNMARLQRKGWIEYEVGIYTVTPEGVKVLKEHHGEA